MRRSRPGSERQIGVKFHTEKVLMWVADSISAGARRPMRPGCQMMILASPQRTATELQGLMFQDCSPEHVLGYKLQRGFYTTGLLAHQLSLPACAELCSKEPSCTGFSGLAVTLSMSMR